MIYDKKDYPQQLLNKAINLYLKSLNKIEPAGPEKCPITFILLYVNKNRDKCENDYVFKRFCKRIKEVIKKVIDFIKYISKKINIKESGELQNYLLLENTIKLRTLIVHVINVWTDLEL